MPYGAGDLVKPLYADEAVIFRRQRAKTGIAFGRRNLEKLGDVPVVLGVEDGQLHANQVIPRNDGHGERTDVKAFALSSRGPDGIGE